MLLSPARSGVFRYEPVIAPFYSRESSQFQPSKLATPDFGFDFSDTIKKKSKKKRGSRGGVKNRLKRNGYWPPTSINNSFKCLCGPFKKYKTWRTVRSTSPWLWLSQKFPTLFHWNLMVWQRWLWDRLSVSIGTQRKQKRVLGVVCVYLLTRSGPGLQISQFVSDSARSRMKSWLSPFALNTFLVNLAK